MTPTLSDEDEAAMSAGIEYVMKLLRQLPKGDALTTEAHLTGVLIVFWGALWGTLGTEYARGFIESQLRGMGKDVSHEIFTEPTVQ